MNDPHLLLSGYVLDALDAEDRAIFEDHLADCEDCRQELAEFGPAVNQLSALTATPPPRQLRDDVMSAISRVRQLDPTPPTDAPGPDTSTPGAATSSAPYGTARGAPADPSRTGPRTTGRPILRTAVALAAAVVVVAAVALGAWSYGRRQLTTTYDAHSAAVSRIIGAPDARTYRQHGPNGMQITYVVSKQRNSALAVVQNSTTPANGRTYQLWTVRISQGTQKFVPDRTFTTPSGPIILSTDIRAAAALGVTVEPAGGSPQPTTKPFAVQPV